MTLDDRLPGQLTDWLADQPSSAPDQLLETVLTDLQTTPQRGRWKVVLRRTPMFGSNSMRLAMALGAVALAVVLGVSLWAGLPPTAGPPVVAPTPPTENEFVPTGSMSQGCAWCPAVLLDDGRVLVVGGWPLTGEGRPYAELPHAELYDPATGTFSPAGTPGTFNQASAVKLNDGRVLLVGGLSDRAEIYDPGTGQFQPTVITYPQGSGGIGALLTDGRVLIMGGMTTAAVIYDPATDDLTPTGSMSMQRGHLTATPLEDGKVLVVGGGTADVYDPAAGVFIRTGPMSTPRSYHTATRLMDGRVLIVGGGPADDTGRDLASAELYDPGTGAFVETGSMHFPRFWHASSLLSDGRVLVTGGGTNELDRTKTMNLDRAEIYDPATGEFTLVGAAMTQPRTAVTAVTLADGRVLVLGHYPGNVPGVSPGSEFPSNTAELFQP